MSGEGGPDLARHLAARLRFLREMTDFPPDPADAERVRSLLARPTGSPEAGGPEDGGETLDGIRSDLGDCTRCALAAGRNTIVFGVGDPDADLMFIGEGPGADEDRQGEPFVGRAGKMLTAIIEKVFRSRREQVYIANVVKCRPPGNRNPKADEVAACLPFLKRQIASVRPRVICLLGGVALKALFPDRTSVGAVRGTTLRFAGIPVVPTYHPAYLLRQGGKRLADLKWKVHSDCQTAIRILEGRPEAPLRR